jgi:uncharacterized DUF497 family protein
MKIDLVVEPDRPEHIARHGVSVSEVREVVESVEYAVTVKKGVLRLVGQTDGGRYLTVFIGSRGGSLYGLITARAATDSEKRGVWRRRRR